MGSEVIRQITEEEWEIRKRSIELKSLEVQLAQRELELATIRGELYNFQSRYLAAVSSRYQEWDDLEAEIAEIQAQLNPENQKAQQQAEQARAQAQESAKTAGDSQKRDPAKRFKPTEKLKKLYREVAKRIHPDLATDEQERLRYQHLMAKANKAYQDGDEICLQNILHQRKNCLTPEKENGWRVKLDRIIRQVAQVKERFAAIELELKEIRKSFLFQLKIKVEAAEANGLDLLSEMAHFLDCQISTARQNLAYIKSKGLEAVVK